MNCAAQKDFIQDAPVKTCGSLLFKLTQKVPSFPSMSIFNCAHFHLCWYQICPKTKKWPNTRRELCTINMTGTFTRWLFMCCVTGRLDGSAKDNGRLKMSPMKSDGAVKLMSRNLCLSSLTGFITITFIMLSTRLWVLPSRVCLELYSMWETIDRGSGPISFGLSSPTSFRFCRRWQFLTYLASTYSRSQPNGMLFLCNLWKDKHIMLYKMLDKTL